MQKSSFYELSGKYLIEERSIKKWQNGASPFGAAIEKFSYDGEKCFQWSQFLPGTNFPDKQTPSEGIISNNISDSPLNKDFQNFKNAIGMGLPLMFYDIEGRYISLGDKKKRFYPHTLFSEYFEVWLQNDCIKSVTSVSNGIWEITSVFKTQKGNFLRSIIIYDINKGGYVTNVRYFVKKNLANAKEFLLTELTLETIRSNDGTWIPKILKKMETNGSEKILFRYKSFEIIKDFREFDYQIVFPEGTLVTDYFSKTMYKVGDITDEDKAIGEFMRRHGLTGDVPNQMRNRGNLIRFILFGVGFLLVVYAVFKMIQRRKTP